MSLIEISRLIKNVILMPSDTLPSEQCRKPKSGKNLFLANNLIPSLWLAYYELANLAKTR